MEAEAPGARTGRGGWGSGATGLLVCTACVLFLYCLCTDSLLPWQRQAEAPSDMEQNKTEEQKRTEALSDMEQKKAKAAARREEELIQSLITTYTEEGRLLLEKHEKEEIKYSELSKTAAGVVAKILGMEKAMAHRKTNEGEGTAPEGTAPDAMLTLRDQFKKDLLAFKDQVSRLHALAPCPAC